MLAKAYALFVACFLLSGFASNAFSNFYQDENCVRVSKTEVIGEFSFAELREVRDQTGAVFLFAVKTNKDTKLDPGATPIIRNESPITLIHETNSPTEKALFQISAIDEPYAFGDGRRAVYVNLKKLSAAPSSMPKIFPMYLVGSAENIDNFFSQKDDFINTKISAQVAVKENIQYTETPKAYTIRTGGFDNETYTDVDAGTKLFASRSFEIKFAKKIFDSLEINARQDLSIEDLAKTSESKECLK